jgi:hypothetical protein
MKFFSGILIAALAVSSWEWALPVCLVIGPAAFWDDLTGLTTELLAEREIAKIRRAATATLHFNCPAGPAWRCFVGRR